MTQGSAFGDPPESGDRFGHGLALLRARRSIYGRLAIGVPGENGSGAVQVIEYGSSNVLTLMQDGVYGSSQPGDEWGFALAALSDVRLAIGANGKASGAGAITILEFEPNQEATVKDVSWIHQTDFPAPFTRASPAASLDSGTVGRPGRQPWHVRLSSEVVAGEADGMGR